MTLRFPRVEQALGLRQSLAEASDQDVWAVLDGAITARLPEGPDLDFKRDWYAVGKGSEIAKDSAALANGTGGVIIVGIDDGGADVAKAWAPFAVPAKVDETVQQAVAANTAPKVPEIVVRVVPKPGDPALGIVLLLIPRSPVAPHALVYSKERLGYPFRRSTTTDWLLESEIAQRYRDRFALAATQQERAERIATVAQRALDRSSYVWLLLSLAPSAPGLLTLSRDTVEDTQRLVEEWQHALLDLSETRILSGLGARVRRGRVVVTSDPYSPLTQTQHHELHLDGSGASAFIVGRAEGPATNQWGEADQRRVELTTLNLLDLLVQHAVKAGASGDAVCTASLLPAWSDSELDEVVTMPDITRTDLTRRPGLPLLIRAGGRPPGPLELQHARRVDVEPAQWTVPLGAVSTEARELVAAAAHVSLAVLAEDGISESDVITLHGELDIDAPPPQLRERFHAWAVSREVPIKPRVS